MPPRYERHAHLGLRMNFQGKDGIVRGGEVYEPLYCITTGERAHFRVDDFMLRLMAACGEIKNFSIEPVEFWADEQNSTGRWLNPHHWKGQQRKAKVKKKKRGEVRAS